MGKLQQKKRNQRITSTELEEATTI